MDNTFEKPKFSPNEWECIIEAGCYPYAMNWTQRNEYMLIGDIIGKPMESYRTDEELIGTLIKELEFLGYTVKQSNLEEEMPNCIKIYLMRAKFSGRYHLFREDADGWSHKYNGKLPTNLDFFGNALSSPDKICGDDYYGWFFLVSKKAG